jgi:hypothetical protein
MLVNTGNSNSNLTSQKTDGAVPFVSADDRMLTGDFFVNIKNLEQI